MSCFTLHGFDFLRYSKADMQMPLIISQAEQFVAVQILRQR